MFLDSTQNDMNWHGYCILPRATIFGLLANFLGGHDYSREEQEGNLQIPLSRGIKGVCYAKKDYSLPKHPEIDVPNLQVIKLMQSFKSKEDVHETFIVPATLRKYAKPLGRPMGRSGFHFLPNRVCRVLEALLVSPPLNVYVHTTLILPIIPHPSFLEGLKVGPSKETLIIWCPTVIIVLVMVPTFYDIINIHNRNIFQQAHFQFLIWNPFLLVTRLPQFAASPYPAKNQYQEEEFIHNIDWCQLLGVEKQMLDKVV
ncbi:40S ribosomal protein s10 [Striga asiatica]|uniref:40S ribosomal protein s10 n=1 Tax=Striga asiatica TaxID=4170 RepID=A0A5A7Q366_STRAF|nr:40S ribosomal protein s10 [Striga asiatica]